MDSSCSCTLISHVYRYVPLFLERVRVLLRHNLKPVLVFDGSQPRGKEQTATRRRQCVLFLCKIDMPILLYLFFFCFSFGVAARACRQRAKALTEAKSLFSDKRYAEARKKLLQSLSRTQRVQEALLRALDAAEIPVQYIVAPYEADSQLAWMVRTGHLDCVLSQDTDLIPLGCPLVSETVRCLSLISRLIEMLTLVPCMRTHDFVRALQPSAGPFQDGLEVR